MSHRYYFFGHRHSYDGVQGTGRPTQFGSWAVSRSERKAEIPMNLKVHMRDVPIWDSNLFEINALHHS
jgi:hypothetical protein